MQLEGEKQSHLDSALAELESASDVPYYDEAADTEAREIYYRSIEAPSATLVSELLERTHTSRPSYSPLNRLYPWVDLHPDRLIRSIYSGKDFEPEELIRADAEIEAARTERAARTRPARDGARARQALEAELDALEARFPSTASTSSRSRGSESDEPMRGDLHHLFACESGCNSFRGNSPYFDFPDAEEVVRSDCGRSEADSGFEPARGQGPGRAGDALLPAALPAARSATRRPSSKRTPALLLALARAATRSATTSATATRRSPRSRATATR